MNRRTSQTYQMADGAVLAASIVDSCRILGDSYQVRGADDSVIGYVRGNLGHYHYETGRNRSRVSGVDRTLQGAVERIYEIRRGYDWPNGGAH